MSFSVQKKIFPALDPSQCKLCFPLQWWCNILGNIPSVPVLFGVQEKQDNSTNPNIRITCTCWTVLTEHRKLRISLWLSTYLNNISNFQDQWLFPDLRELCQRSKDSLMLFCLESFSIDIAKSINYERVRLWSDHKIGCWSDS